MIFPEYNSTIEDNWQETKIHVSLTDPDGIEATRGIAENEFNLQPVIIHGPGLKFSPNAMQFNLLHQEICQGFFTTSFLLRTAIFHVVILRSADFQSDNISIVETAIETCSSMQGFIQTIAESKCAQKGKILRTLRETPV